MESQSPSLSLKICNILLNVVCYAPTAYLLAFYSYVLRVTIRLGHIPRYSGAGTDDFTLDQVHEDISDFTFAVAFFSPFIVFVLAMLTRTERRSRFQKISLIIFVVTLLVAILLFRYDGFTEWYLD